MDKYNERSYFPYSWHQSHDQATVLLMVPHNTQDEDLSVYSTSLSVMTSSPIKVLIETEYLIVGVRNYPPTIKGRLYSAIDSSSSVWQLEPQATRLSARERTTSTTSTASTHSSYAFVSDPDISSSFAASLESGQVSDAEDISSPFASSPTLSSAGDRHLPPIPKRKLPSNISYSRSVSPGRALQSIPSSFSSLDSLHSPHSGRLLTIHLEKEQSIIWPSLIIGPVPENVSPHIANSTVFNASDELEHRYNMDSTSLALIALELFDIRKDKEEAFEFFLRAWHQAHVPSATMRLASRYFPFNETDDIEEVSNNEQPSRGSFAYYLRCIGGSKGLAQLYLEAGLLHLEGAASNLLTSSYSSLSSIRMPFEAQVGEGGTQAWKRDREAAAKYFERARVLQPDLDIPSLPAEVVDNQELEMPSANLGSSTPESIRSGESRHTDPDHEVPTIRRRRKKEEMTIINDHRAELEELDNAWYLYIPGLVGAGTALLVLGVVGALSLSNWSRRSQGS